MPLEQLFLSVDWVAVKIIPAYVYKQDWITLPYHTASKITRLLTICIK